MEIPCLLDPDKICTGNCRLYSYAEQVFQVLLEIYKKSPKDELKLLRQPGIGKLEFRSQNAESLRETGIIDQCNNYPTAEFRPGRDQ